MESTAPTCECSDEYGPCEQHGEVLVTREGASQRTADSLLLLLCHDLIDCGASVSVWGQALLDEADAAEDAAERYGVSWFCTDENQLHDQLTTLADQLTVDAEVSVYFEDGYTIVRLAADCPLLG